MKKLFLLLAVVLLAGCKGQTLLVGAHEEPLYIDKSNHMVAVWRTDRYYYVLWDVTTRQYIYREVPYFHYSNMERQPNSKIICPNS